MANYNHYLPKKIDLKPKAHHGMQVLIFICGFLFPPLAVAVRFGIGSDFFTNLFLCILGYFPSHGHNFYIQNIRNNSNKRRSPKWAIKYGLIDPTDDLRKKAKSQWAGRYNERNSHNDYDEGELEEGQVRAALANPTDTSNPGATSGREERLWDEAELEFYENGEGGVPDSQAPNKQHKHYPFNFEGAGAHIVPKAGSRANGDRFERSAAAYEDTPSSKPGKKSKKNKNAVPMDDSSVPQWGTDYGAPRNNSSNRRNSTSSRSISSLSSRDRETSNNSNTWGSGGGRASRNPAATNSASRDPDGLDHTF